MNIQGQQARTDSGGSREGARHLSPEFLQGSEVMDIAAWAPQGEAHLSPASCSLPAGCDLLVSQRAAPDRSIRSLPSTCQEHNNNAKVCSGNSHTLDPGSSSEQEWAAGDSLAPSQAPLSTGQAPSLPLSEPGSASPARAVRPWPSVGRSPSPPHPQKAQQMLVGYEPVNEQTQEDTFFQG